jgi:hypothetical protein
MGQHFSEQEIKELKEEIEHYEKEKEQLRKVIGRVGGAPKFNTKLIMAICYERIGHHRTVSENSLHDALYDASQPFQILDALFHRMAAQRNYKKDKSA